MATLALDDEYVDDMQRRQWDTEAVAESLVIDSVLEVRNEGEWGEGGRGMVEGDYSRGGDFTDRAAFFSPSVPPRTESLDQRAWMRHTPTRCTSACLTAYPA